MDSIRIQGINAFGFHGVAAEERARGQHFVAEVELSLSLEAASHSDDLEDTVDYAEVIRLVRKIIGGEAHKTLEAVAGKIVAAILEQFSLVQAVKLTLIKPEAPIEQFDGEVSVTLERGTVRMSPFHQVILGLGSNLGDRATMLASARYTLGELPGTHLLAASPIYETEPVGYTEQPLFLNQVVAVETLFSPTGLLRECLALEHEHGRERDIPNGPRTLDVDLLFYDNLRFRSPDLELPHPRWQERAFVVAPLVDLLTAGPLADEERWDELRCQALALPARAGVVCWMARSESGW